ncbi:MAG: NADH oxidase [Flavobacteriales bacterium]|nr:NADH oxidase [Flavobacteriales bacterium]|tara:strand:+ start:381 stop:677 length:297 start_codon:yes stop_codon:yes gene_type:complete
MTVQELKRLIDGNEDINIIDIRESYEFEDGAICEVNIPLAQFLSRINEIPKDKLVVLYCNSGKRSHSLKYMIEKLHSYNNFTHLEGGFQKWQKEVTTL